MVGVRRYTQKKKHKRGNTSKQCELESETFRLGYVLHSSVVVEGKTCLFM